MKEEGFSICAGGIMRQPMQGPRPTPLYDLQPKTPQPLKPPDFKFSMSACSIVISSRLTTSCRRSLGPPGTELRNMKPTMRNSALSTCGPTYQLVGWAAHDIRHPALDLHTHTHTHAHRETRPWAPHLKDKFTVSNCRRTERPPQK